MSVQIQVFQIIRPKCVEHGLYHYQFFDFGLVKVSSKAHRLDLTFVMMGWVIGANPLVRWVCPWTCRFAVDSLRVRARLPVSVFAGESNTW